MIRPFAYALVPVLLGAAFAFVPGLDRRLLGPLHAFAFGAALTVVLAELLPGATTAVGWPALVVFAAGLALPVLLERGLHGWARRRGDPDGGHGAAVEIAFAGLVIHQVLDGLQVGAAGALEGGMGLVLAIAAHSTPLIAVTVLGYAHHDGARTALLRAGGLLLATALGVGIGLGASDAWIAPYSPWARAAVAGLLLHILGHDLAERPPPGWGARLVHLAGMLSGVLLPLAWLGATGHIHLLEDLPTASAVITALCVLVLSYGLWLAGLLRSWFPLAHGQAPATHDHHHGEG